MNNNIETSISVSFPNDSPLSYFGSSKINVGVGNTIVSFALCGIGPSVVAYSILKILEENDETEDIIPYSLPITLPVTAFIVNRVLNMNILSLLAAGGLYSCYLYLRGNSFPSQLSTTFRNIMWNVSSFFSRFIQKSRYICEDRVSMWVYTIYLPEYTRKENVTVCWTSADQKEDVNSFGVYINEPNNSMTKYVECDINYPVDAKQVIVNYTHERDDCVLKISIPKYESHTVILTTHYCVYYKQVEVYLSF